MADLIERLRLQAEIGLLDAANTPGHVVASYAEAATEIERLTAELTSARALLARYEQAPVVGLVWHWTIGRSTKALHFVQGKERPSFHPVNEPNIDAIPLIVRPEAKP